MSSRIVMVLANCPATITLTGSSTWKSGRYITSHIPCLIIRSWTGTKFQCARRVTASLKVTYASELRICVEMRRHVGMSAAGVRSRIRVKLFFLFPLFSLFPHEPPFRRYSTGQWVLIDRSLGGPFERRHNAKWREIGGWLVEGGVEEIKEVEKKGRD